MTLGHHIWIPLLGHTWIDDKKFGHPKEEWNQVFISKEKCSIFHLKFWFAAYFFTQFSNEKKFYSFSSSAEINKLFIVLYYTSEKWGPQTFLLPYFSPSSANALYRIHRPHPFFLLQINMLWIFVHVPAAPIYTTILPMNMSAHPAIVLLPT